MRMFKYLLLFVVLFTGIILSQDKEIDTLSLFPDTTTFINSNISVLEDVSNLGIRYYCDSSKIYLLKKIIVIGNSQISTANPYGGTLRISTGPLPEDSVLYKAPFELTTGYPNWQTINLDKPVLIKNQKCFYITGLELFLGIVPSRHYDKEVLNQFLLWSYPQPVWHESAYFYFAIKAVLEGQTSGVDHNGDQKVSTYGLSQNYPNPFNSETIIQYNLPMDDQVKIEAIDMLGRVVSVLYSGFQKSGEHRLSFHAEGLSGGIYFIRMLTPSFSDIRKVVYLK